MNNIMEVVESSPSSLYAKIPGDVKAANPALAAQMLRLEYRLADVALRHAKRDAPVLGNVVSIVLKGLANNQPESLDGAIQAIRRVRETKPDNSELEPVLLKGVELMSQLGFKEADIREGLTSYYGEMKLHFMQAPDKYAFSGVSHE